MTTCKIRFDGGRPRYIVDGVEVSEKRFHVAQAREMREEAKKHGMQAGRRFPMPGCFGDRKDWRLENGGKGRYCHQLGDQPKDPKAYCGSYSEMMEKAKRKGFAVDTDN